MIEPTDDDERTNSLGLFNTAEADPEANNSPSISPTWRDPAMNARRFPLPWSRARPKKTWGGRTLDSEKEKAAEAASAYVIDIPSLGASLHKCPTDHTDRAYRRRPEQSNPAGRAIHHRHSSCSSRDIRDGGDRNTNLRLPARC